MRFGFLAFNAIGETPRATANTPGAAEIRMPPRTGPIERRRRRHGWRAPSASSTARVDVVIVLPHWGDQYTHRPSRTSARSAGALVDAGADLVLGGHPHWVQGVEMSQGGLIAYSLGNFVFDMDVSSCPQTREGIMLDLVFWGGELEAVRPVPVRHRAATSHRGSRLARAARPSSTTCGEHSAACVQAVSHAQSSRPTRPS